MPRRTQKIAWSNAASLALQFDRNGLAPLSTPGSALKGPASNRTPELPEPQHGYEEQQEPDQELTSAPHSAGRSPSDSTKAGTIIVGGVSTSFMQCFDTNDSLLRGEVKALADPSFWVTIKEGSPSSFRARRYDYFTLGKAKPIIGTRIQIRFHNLGAAVHTFVPSTVPLTELSQPPPTSTTSKPDQPATRARLQLVATSFTNEGCSQPGFKDVNAPGSNQLIEITYVRDTGYATYEVVQSDPKVVHEAKINVYVAFIAGVSQNLPALGTTTLTTVFTPDPGSQPVETAPRLAFAINACPSALLFPFVSNQGGLDTRIVIANTSRDPFVTSSERGTVTLYFYGNEEAEGDEWRPPEAFSTQTIAAGKQLDFNLLKGGNFGMPAVPGFQGYIIARANFRLSYGFAVISGPNGESAASYPAERISARTGLKDRD